MNKGGAGGVGGLGSGGGGGGSGPTAAAAASAAQKQKMLMQRVENDIGSIVDNFSHLVNVSRVIFPCFFIFLIYIRSCGCIFQKLPYFYFKK
jgi:mediator of RNA polymerase II transcription subunit 22